MKEKYELFLFGNEGKLDNPPQVKIIDIIPLYPNKDNMVFIEVGANDGVDNDPIRDWVKKYNWTGVLIEPIDTAFEDLKNNYNGVSGISFENVAISNSDDEYAIMYRPRSSKISSLDKDHAPMKGKYKEVKVRIKKLNDIIDQYDISNLDLLNIDAEGYDFEVIKSLDFDKCRPVIIHYEHRHLGDAKSDCEKYLLENGYFLCWNRNNTIAINKKFKDISKCTLTEKKHHGKNEYDELS